MTKFNPHKKPVPPVRPKEPSLTCIKVYSDEIIVDSNPTEVFDWLNKYKDKLSEIKTSISYFDDCRHVNSYYYSIETEVPNPYYETELLKYNKKINEYNIKLEKYKNSLREWEKQKEEYDKEMKLKKEKEEIALFFKLKKKLKNKISEDV